MRSTPPARSTLLVVAGAVVGVLAVLFVGCDTGDGRVLADPAPDATAPPLLTTTLPTQSTEAPGLGTVPDPGGLLLGSPAFAVNGEIPTRYTCDGDDLSPPLGWVNVPEGTVELAITVVDPDAPDGQFIHWVIAGLDPAIGGLEEGEVPETAVEARNDTTEFGWFGPCPPAGEKHSYVFTLFALSEPSGVAAGASGQEAIDAIATTPGVATVLTGTYTGP